MLADRFAAGRFSEGHLRRPATPGRQPNLCGGPKLSVYVMSWVFRNSKAELGDRLVLLAIADFADDDGYCWPSIAKIAEKTLMSERAVQYSVRALESRGELTVSIGTGDGRRNEYRVLQGRNPCTLSESPKGADSDDLRVQITTSKGANNDSFSAPFLSESSGNHQLEPSKEPPPPLPDHADRLASEFEAKNARREARAARRSGRFPQNPRYPPQSTPKVQRSEPQATVTPPKASCASPRPQTGFRARLWKLAEEQGVTPAGPGVPDWMLDSLGAYYLGGPAAFLERAGPIFEQAREQGLTWAAALNALYLAEKSRSPKGATHSTAEERRGWLAGREARP